LGYSHFKTYDYNELLVSAGSEAEFIDTSESQTISFIRINHNEEEYMIYDLRSPEKVIEFHEELIKKISSIQS
jgi:hypothetical protein